MNKNCNETECQLLPYFNKKVCLVRNEETGWKRLVKDIVRPPRSLYHDMDLGSKNFVLNGVRYQRIDNEVQHSGKKIAVTHYQPDFKNNWLILYLHGNSSSKFEAIGLLKYIPFRFSLASFDFLGCGLNQQADSISLGHRQAGQVQSVVQSLTSQGFRVIVWGRSMGAATALKFGKAPIIVADSSFANFKKLCHQMAVRHSPSYIPNCLISCIFPCVFFKLREDVKKIGNYDIQALDVLQSVKKIKQDTRIIFMSAENDQLIEKENSMKLYNSFQGKHKHIQIFPGSHNTKRPIQILKKVMNQVQLYTIEIQSSQRQVSTKKAQNIEAFN